MNKRTQLGEVMETTCSNCGSRFRLTEPQLRKALGQVRCSECGSVFNALHSLKSYEGELPPGFLDKLRGEQRSADSKGKRQQAAAGDEQKLSLHEAMYGSEGQSFFSIGPVGWFIGILLLTAAGVAQAVYYQRYQLIENPRYQQQVVALCRILPCAEAEFAAPEQVRMLERNVFTHPVAGSALMVTGSFSNQAPFAQKLPSMLISLFDIQGKLIANRLFEPGEYLLENRDRRVFQSGATVQFRLEIVDPGIDALTYEFEFY